jgi:hypothetical protein
MENLSKLSKSFLFICMLFGALWFGGYLLRILLTFQLYEPKDYILKQYINSQNLSGILTTLNTAVTYTLIVYPIFILTFIMFLVISKINLKNEGWLFIILLIIVITMPFEIYLMVFDYNIAGRVFAGSFNANDIMTLYTKRMSILSSFSLIELFSYCGIIFLIVFKPLRIKPQ